MGLGYGVSVDGVSVDGVSGQALGQCEDAMGVVGLPGGGESSQPGGGGCGDSLAPSEASGAPLGPVIGSRCTLVQ